MKARDGRERTVMGRIIEKGILVIERVFPEQRKLGWALPLVKDNESEGIVVCVDLKS